MIIKIKNLHAETVIGVYDWEKEIDRELHINIELEINSTRAAQSDDVNDTLNYATLSEMIISEVARTRFNLLEKLSSHLLDKIMENKIVERAKIEIDKGNIVPGVDNVSVIDERTRKA